jgi:hypothetical protein
MRSVNGDVCTRLQRSGNAFDGICSKLSADNLKKDWARVTVSFTPRIVPFAPAAGLGDHLKLSDRTTLYRIAFGLPLHSANLTEVGEVGIFSWQLPTFRCLP